MKPKKKYRRGRGLGLDSGLDLAISRFIYSFAITRERAFLLPCLKTATGGLIVTIKSQVVVYASAERAERLLLFLLYPCLLCGYE